LCSGVIDFLPSFFTATTEKFISRRDAKEAKAQSFLGVLITFAPLREK